MNDTSNQQKCGIPGCGVAIPAELERDALCVSHFLLAAEAACTAIRREEIPGGADNPRRVQIQDYVSSAAMKLARLGTGKMRLSDETKKRILTAFLSLMIVRENLDRTSGVFQPRRQASKTEAPAELVAA
jgi:hypothetical protein